MGVEQWAEFGQQCAADRLVLYTAGIVVLAVIAAQWAWGRASRVIRRYTRGKEAQA